MYTPFRQSGFLIDGCIDPAGFRSSCITVIEGSSSLVPDTLFHMCAATACTGHDVVLIDGANSFNPYAVSKAVKSMGHNPGSVLSHIHVARAFTEYQMDAIMGTMEEAVTCWNAALVAVLYMSYLFSTDDGKRLFGPLLADLRHISRSYGLVTVVTSFGGNWWGDRVLAQTADRVIRIDRKKDHVTVRDGENVFDYVAVPPGQMRFTDFVDCNALVGGDAIGQNCAELQDIA
ncbi:MAG: hypothetical protein J5U17_06800 [Candidatus Methanoperedens sp.]|nr:hypothetical protein [Candidatus Methanoperedens sp.]MCE8425472.1 hypothetical protein [Candidatus Methanoperedens sp.]MCE8427933.1 hypothetical protein [Candidatus Methanoperedens sp.]